MFFDVYLKSEYGDMMPTNVTANVTFGDFQDEEKTIPYQLLDQYLPGRFYHLRLMKLVILH